MFRKLEFLVIGAQKAGTTALYHYLHAHPELYLPKIKELHFFDNETLMRRPRLFREARYHVNFWDSTSNQLLGEITPSYMFEEICIQRIHSYRTDIKLIIILRDPVHRAYSHWNMERGRGTETRNFVDAVNDERAFGYRDRHSAYLHRGLYARQLHHIFRFFPPNQVLVLYQDDLKTDPLASLNQIASFLMISAWDQAEKIQVHEGKYEEALSTEIEKQLRVFFEKDVLELECLLRRSFSMWM